MYNLGFIVVLFYQVSAQESRRKKKEYVDGLESRVKTCTDQNRVLQKKVNSLEEQNKTLLKQLKSLQELVSSSNQSKKQTSTCILVLFLAFALVAFPFQNFTSSLAKTNTVVDPYSTMSGMAEFYCFAASNFNVNVTQNNKGE